MRTLALLAISLFVLAAAPDAQQVPPQTKPRPHLPLDLEMSRLHRDVPPVPVPRNPGEFERMQGVLIRYPLGIPYPLIAEMATEDTVFTLVRDLVEEAEVAAIFASQGINLENVRFVHAPTNSIYTRDYGPWHIFDGNEEPAIVNHYYESGAIDDNEIPRRIAEYLGIPVFDLGLIHVGGNYQSDGHGTAITTRKVYDYWRDYTEAEIDSIMYAFLGIDRNTCLPYFHPGGLGHIDCWAKLLTPERIVVKRVPESDPDYERIENNVAILASMETCFGRPYQIYRVDELGPENYTNSLILNGKVYVPLFESPNDDPALAMFEEALPGYEVLGFGNWWWGSGDALHCRTKEMADTKMLFVDHAPLLDTDRSTGGYRVDVRIQDYSHEGLIADSLTLFWAVEGAPDFTEVPLTPGAGPDSFYAEIPAQPLGTTIEYYLRAADHSGRRETHPIVGRRGPHRFQVKTDDQPPTIEHDPIGDLPQASWPATVTALIRDDIQVQEATVEWWIDGQPQAAAPMEKRDGFFLYDWTFTIPAAEGDVFSYRIRATDGTSVSYDPPTGTYHILIIPPPSLLLWNPDSSPTSGAALHQILVGVGTHHEYSTADDMPDLTRYACVFIFLGVCNENRILSADEAAALADYLDNGGWAYMEGGDCWGFDSHREVYLSHFGIDHAADGAGDIERVEGLPGTLGDGMVFDYAGGNQYMDEIWPAPGAETFFVNPDDGNPHAISYVAESRRTIASAFEFGGLVDGEDPSTKLELLTRYAEFFDWALMAEVMEEPRSESAGPRWLGSNPLSGIGTLRFSMKETGTATVRIFGPDGRLVRTLLDGVVPAGAREVVWDGRGSDGRPVCAGVYLCRLTSAHGAMVQRIVRVR